MAQAFTIKSRLKPDYLAFSPSQYRIMDVLSAIPHRPPFLFVDNVISIDDTNIIAERTWRAEEAFYKGHYPGNPLTPGVLLCEALFQTAAVLLSERIHKDAENIKGTPVPVLAKIVNTKFKRMIRPGEKTVFSVTLKEKLNGFYFLEGKVTIEGKTALTSEFALALVDQDSAK
jgi:3-hydroxyacyl-[acyl-carrier-protein] dehydratase